MLVEVRLPSLGDDDDAVAGGAVSQLLAAPGVALKAGDDLMELTTDKAAFVVPCPIAGCVIRWRVAEGEQILVGVVLCEMSAA